jgi:hypothetical protein
LLVRRYPVFCATIIAGNNNSIHSCSPFSILWKFEKNHT